MPGPCTSLVTLWSLEWSFFFFLVFTELCNKKAQLAVFDLLHEFDKPSNIGENAPASWEWSFTWHFSFSVINICVQPRHPNISSLKDGPRRLTWAGITTVTETGLRQEGWQRARLNGGMCPCCQSGLLPQSQHPVNSKKLCMSVEPPRSSGRCGQGFRHPHLGARS